MSQVNTTKNVEKYLKEDQRYLDYKARREYYKSIRYDKTDIYDCVRFEFSKKFKLTEELRKLMFNKCFDNCTDKTFTTFEQSIETEINNRNATEEYINLVSSIADRFSNAIESNLVTVDDIIDMCNIHLTLDRYEGFIFEHILKESLINEGFAVMSNKTLDSIYKIDLLVGHPNSNKAIAIQCKSISYLNKYYNEREEHVKSMYRFKNEAYKTFQELQYINDIELKYILHQNNDILSSKENALIDADNLLKYIELDKDIDWSILKGYTVYQYKTIDEVIDEIKQILNISIK